MGSDLSAAHWLLRYSVRLRERDDQASDLKTFATHPADATEPLLLPPAPPRRRKRARAVSPEVMGVPMDAEVAGMPVVAAIEATEVDVPVFLESVPAPAVDDPTDVDAVRVIFESARAPRVAAEPRGRSRPTAEVEAIFRTPSVVARTVTDRMPPIAEAEWTPIEKAPSDAPRPVVVVARAPSPTSPVVAHEVADERTIATPTSVSDLRGAAVAMPPRVSFALSLTPPPLPELPRLSPPAVVLEMPTPPPAVEAPPVREEPPAAPAVKASALPMPVFCSPAVMAGLPERPVLALPPAELPNPWKSESAPAAPPASPTPAPTPAPESARLVLLRSAILLVVSGIVGLAAHTGLARARRVPAPAPVQALAPAATPSAPPPLAPPAPAESPASATTEGDLEVRAPAGAPIAIDGKVRGAGPGLTVRLAPGFHSVRVGVDKTSTIEVHRGDRATIDLSK